MKIPIIKYRVVEKSGWYHIQTWRIYWPFWMLKYQHAEGSSLMSFESEVLAMEYLRSMKRVRDAEKSPYVVVREFRG